MRWSRERSYDIAILNESQAQGVPAVLIKGVIGAESAFVSSATRGEPQIGDASYGLMQVLYRTAKALGYTGEPGGLLDPATNIHYGTKLLAQNLARAGGDVDSAISAYNGGFRAKYGFGQRATALIKNVCLARDKTGNCVRSVDVQPGFFANQVYVERVKSNMRYFEAQDRPPVPPVPTTPLGGGSPLQGLTVAALVSGALLGLFLWWRSR